MRAASASLPTDLDTDLLLWRRKALSILLWAVAVVRTGQVIYLFHNGFFLAQPLSFLVGYLTLYVALVVVAVFKGLPHGLRGWMLFTLGYLNVLGAFANTGGIAAQTPLTLLTIPIYAAILLGRRAAGIAALLSVSLFTGIAIASHFQWIVAPLAVGAQ